jgi:hypothetical protein
LRQRRREILRSDARSHGPRGLRAQVRIAYNSECADRRANGWSPPRALRQVALPGEAAPAVIAAIPFPEGFVGIPQVMPERPPALLVLPHIAIDGLVTDREAATAPEPADDLLWAPVVPQPDRHGRPVRRGEPRVPPRARAATVRIEVGQQVPIAAVIAGGVATELPADRARRAAQGPGNRPKAQPLARKHGEGVPFLQGDLAIGHGFLSLGGGLKPSLFQVTSLACGSAGGVALRM